MRLVGDAIQQGRSQIRISKYLRPVTKAKVRGDDHRFSLMAFGQNPEYQFRALFGKRHISQLIDDQQTVTGITLYYPTENFLVTGFYQFVYQGTA